ncbi:RteC domain-containing protein [Porphyromonas macacae]|uniref:RteC domain-containing protein n=1 Tax=Porphyromonas macacae TaxID=28115 RepID=UPI0009DE740C|nr:RteC domain-containing protein [Porphyromonas macacae]
MKRSTIKKNVALPEKKEVLNDFFDDLLSFIQAEKRYIVFCLKYKFIEGERESKPKERLKVQTKLQWTATKVDLVELIYALYYARCINNGEAEIKNITEAFELLFNINLGKYYRTYIDVTRRKINRSKFLCSLIKITEEELIEKDSK